MKQNELHQPQANRGSRDLWKPVRIRYTPAVGLDTNLLIDTVRYVLSGYRPEDWQTEITNEQLLTLARSLQPEHHAVIRESRVWVDLKE